MFTRIFSHNVSQPMEMLRNRLLGTHINIRDLDFEVTEKNHSLRIVPHAEQIDEIRALPITYVELKEKNGETEVKITSHLRRFDKGGPILTMIACAIMVAAAVVLWIAKEHFWGIVVLTAAIAIYSTFRYRLEKGYFDYVRKIRAHVMNTAGMQLS